MKNGKRKPAHRRPARKVFVYTYSLLDLMAASPTAPMPIEKRTHQLNRMWQGLAAIEKADEPTVDDWRVCSDALNLLETLVLGGVCEDTSGLLHDGMAALAEAGRRRLKGGTIRLSGQGIQTVRAVLEDYASALEQISHRTALMTHRATEKRIHEIMQGKRTPHDVEVMDL